MQQEVIEVSWPLLYLYNKKALTNIAWSLLIHWISFYVETLQRQWSTSNRVKSGWWVTLIEPRKNIEVRDILARDHQDSEYDGRELRLHQAADNKWHHQLLSWWNTEYGGPSKLQQSNVIQKLLFLSAQTLI